VFLVSKNKRAQVLFRRGLEGDKPPDIFFESPLRVTTEGLIIMVDSLNTVVESEYGCKVVDELTLSLENEPVLSLDCE
jgi:hypothetical protein